MKIRKFLSSLAVLLFTSVWGGVALANPLDIDAGDAYPTEVGITSPYQSVVSVFEWNSTYTTTLSDSNYLIDAYFNMDGTLSSYNSVTITTALWS